MTKNPTKNGEDKCENVYEPAMVWRSPSLNRTHDWPDKHAWVKRPFKVKFGIVIFQFATRQRATDLATMSRAQVKTGRKEHRIGHPSHW